MEGLDTDRSHRLGSRAFLLFLGKGIFLVLLLFIGLAALWWYAPPYVPADYVIYYEYALKLASLILLAWFAFLLMRAFLAYRAHEYRFDDEFFHITRGYLDRHETGVVYHQIQTVTVRRPVGARLIGVAHLVIVTSGVQGGGSQHVELPAIDMRKARLVQRELLARARMDRHDTLADRQPRYRQVRFDDLEDEEGEE